MSVPGMLGALSFSSPGTASGAFADVEQKTDEEAYNSQCQQESSLRWSPTKIPKHEPKEIVENNVSSMNSRANLIQSDNLPPHPSHTQNNFLELVMDIPRISNPIRSYEHRRTNIAVRVPMVTPLIDLRPGIQLDGWLEFFLTSDCNAKGAAS